MQGSSNRQTNKLVIRNQQSTSKKKTSKKSGEAKKNAKKRDSFLRFMFNQRMIQIYGIIAMSFAMLLMISIFSYFFHYHTDVSHVTSSVEAPGNIAGTVGAHLSYFFVNYFFGIFSIGFVLLFFISGVQMTFNKQPLPLFKTAVTTLLTMAWCSMLLGLFFAQSGIDFIAGAFGNFTSQLLLHSTGKLVTGIIMAILFFIILILCYNVSMHSLLSLQLPKRSDHSEAIANKKKKKETPEGEVANAVATATDTKLPDLYIENRNGLSNEYRGNVYHFENDDTQEFEVSQNESVSEISFANLLDKNRSKQEETNQVPFEIIDHSLMSDSEEEMPDDETEFQPEEKSLSSNPFETLEEYDPCKDLSTYQFPSISLLNDYPSKEANEEVMRRELTENKDKIERTLKNFNIPIKRITATVGPTVTLYEIVPDDGVRISKIKNLEDDIALSLSALGIRIIAPIPGRGTIGIEVPNKSANIVSMKEIIASDKFQNNKYDLPIGLGKTISNEPFVVDLAKMPHLLMAGATGQGKSVGLNAVISSLLYKKHPAELKFVLVDPKKVEFTLYSAIENHYLAKLPDNEEAIITDTKKVVRTLNSLCKEMDQRYDLLKMAKTRNIKEYNAKFCSRKLSPTNGHRYLPYIVLIIDEFGDLIMTAGKEVELPIARLAQLARAIGIHLIIATQRPSVNIITGIIKANFPARIAFRVSSKIDSRTILDGSGADQLIGKGDMLISTGSDLIRLQCAFVDTPEVEAIAHHIEDQQAYPEPFLLPDVPEETKGKDENGEEQFNSDEIDEMFMEAATLIVQTQQGSTSQIQRKLKLGYNRAGRIMDQLEEFGIVGPAVGSKAREVKVKTNEELMNILQRMGLI